MGPLFSLLPNPSHNVYSDATGTYGCGAVVEIFGYPSIRGEWPL